MISPGFFLHIYCIFFHTFTVILSLVTQSNFCFPADYFRFLTPNNWNNVLSVWQVEKKMFCSLKHSIYFITTVYSVFNFWSVQFKYSVQPCIKLLFKLCCFSSFSRISIYFLLPLKWHVHMIYIAFLHHPICSFLDSQLFSLKSQKFELLIYVTWTSFDFPTRRFELLGGDCSLMQMHYSTNQSICTVFS